MKPRDEISNSKTFDPSTTPGGFLRNLRLANKMEIGELAARTCINESVIDSLERDDWIGLPMVYVRGYVRLICREFNADPKRVLRSLDSYARSWETPIIPDRVQKGSGINKSTFAAAVILTTLLVGLLSNLFADAMGEQSTPSKSFANEKQELHR